MRPTNFCSECGARLSRKGWRARLRGSACDDCARKAGRVARFKPLIAIAIVGGASFAFGRFLRPAPPPLIIHRLANSPLSDLPEDPNRPLRRSPNQTAGAQPADETVYICGARTQKGTPCRRRVHAAGDRCFQHKGKMAILPLEKLVVK